MRPSRPPPPASASLSHLKGKQSQYIRFLCALCECDGVGIRRNQRTICRSLLEKSPGLLLRMRVEDDQCVSSNTFF